MDLIKAQRLLIKIQAFLDNGNGHELSRLEKDLMKSYIIQLYDAVSNEEQNPPKETSKRMETPPAVVEKFEVPVVQIPEVYKHQETTPAYVETQIQKPVEVPPVISLPVVKPVYIAPQTEPKYSAAPIDHQVIEIKPTPQTIFPFEDSPDVLAKLFELSSIDEVSDRFSHIPIANIETALGLNERIFTLNELFGGNRELFETTCVQLNNLQSYAQAKTILLHGPARQFNWSDPERIKMAEHFIRIVSRRYPKP